VLTTGRRGRSPPVQIWECCYPVYRALIDFGRLLLRHEGGVQCGHGLPDSGILRRRIDLRQDLVFLHDVALCNEKPHQVARHNGSYIDGTHRRDPAVDRKHTRNRGEGRDLNRDRCWPRHPELGPDEASECQAQQPGSAPKPESTLCGRLGHDRAQSWNKGRGYRFISRRRSSPVPLFVCFLPRPSWLLPKVFAHW
jgi:hypothetical protein